MDKFYSVKQIACLLNVGTETVRRWIRDGEMQGCKDSKKGGFRVSQSNLDTFIRLHPKYKIHKLTGDNAKDYALANLNQRIFELEDLIANLHRNLDELREVRDLWTKGEA